MNPVKTSRFLEKKSKDKKSRFTTKFMFSDSIYLHFQFDDTIRETHEDNVPTVFL
jgi:hypothetical protein